MNIFRYKDYREAISALLANYKEAGKDVSSTGLADAIQVQKTYVSRVLKGNAHFNSDQLFGACQYLELTDSEWEYLFLLLEYDRSVHQARRKILLGQIHEKQNEKKDVRKHYEAKFVEKGQEEPYFEYYLDPYLPLIHMFLTLPQYRQSPAMIGEKLSLPKAEMQLALAKLEKMNIIKKGKIAGAYELLVQHLFLPKDSPLYVPCELLSRQMTAQHLRKLPPDKRVLVSLSFSADEKTRAIIHEEFLKFLRTADALIKDAREENIYHLSFDLFQWDPSSV